MIIGPFSRRGYRQAQDTAPGRHPLPSQPELSLANRHAGHPRLPPDEVEEPRKLLWRTAQDVDHQISLPDVVSLKGDDLKVVSSGRVTDRFFKRGEAVECHPEPVELEAIAGTDAVRVPFIVQGSGSFTMTVDSAKGGLLRTDYPLP
jgi:hypothetical protein